MNLPAKLVIHDVWGTGDGGSTGLRATDDNGREHTIELRVEDLFRVPKWLYFDDELVPVRSPLEKEIVRLLRKAKVRSLWEGKRDEHGDKLLRDVVTAVIEYVESPQYPARAAQETNERTSPDQ